MTLIMLILHIVCTGTVENECLVNSNNCMTTVSVQTAPQCPVQSPAESTQYVEQTLRHSALSECPCGLGDQNSANVCPCACRKRRLTMGYILSYTTGLLHAWPSCMQ